MILAVDPGTKFHGMACFVGGVLTRAFLVPREGLSTAGVEWPHVDRVIIEQPHKQRRTVNFNVLTQLACAAGEVAGYYAARGGAFAQVKYIWASDWKNTLDKNISHGRIRACLSKRELAVIQMPRAVKTLGHNVLDAVGIGLHEVGRIVRGNTRKVNQ